LIPLGSKGYIGKQGFTGNVNEDPELGFYTPNYEFVQDIGSLKLNSGLQMGYPFSIFNNEVLYWRTLDREIYSIDEDLNFDVKYVVDFVGKNVPDFDFKDDYMKIQYINTVPEAYAVCLFDVEETDDYVSFVFLYGKTKNVAIYSKTTNSTSVCKFSWGHTESLNTIIPHKDKIIVVTDQENGNSIVYLMDIDDIIK
jgi:hypothetical protein